MTATAIILALTLLVAGVSIGAVINAIDGSRTEVGNAYTAASDGDTIAIPAGKFGWSSALTVRKTGLRFSGAGTNSSGTWFTNVQSGLQDYLFIVESNSCTFSNIVFVGTNGPLVSGGFYSRALDLAGYHAQATRCLFMFFDTAVIHHRPGTVVYKNMFLENRIFGRCFGEGDGSANWTTYGPAGTVNYATTNWSFFEDNIVDQSPSMPGDASVAWSSQQGQLWQIRNNQFTFRSGWDYSPIFDSHGAFTGERSGIGALIGSNYFDFSGSGASWDRFVDIRGGSALVYSNVVINAVDNSRAIFMRCKDGDETPYFSNGGIEQCTNIWYWQNTMNGSAFSVQVEANDASIIVAGASYSNATPAFGFQAPYPMPLRDDAIAQSITPVITYPRLRGLRIKR